MKIIKIDHGKISYTYKYIIDSNEIIYEIYYWSIGDNIKVDEDELFTVYLNFGSDDIDECFYIIFNYYGLANKFLELFTEATYINKENLKHDIVAAAICYHEDTAYDIYTYNIIDIGIYKTIKLPYEKIIDLININKKFNFYLNIEELKKSPEQLLDSLEDAGIELSYMTLLCNRNTIILFKEIIEEGESLV